MWIVLLILILILVYIYRKNNKHNEHQSDRKKDTPAVWLKPFLGNWRHVSDNGLYESLISIEYEEKSIIISIKEKVNHTMQMPAVGPYPEFVSRTKSWTEITPNMLTFPIKNNTLVIKPVLKTYVFKPTEMSIKNKKLCLFGKQYDKVS